MTMSAVLDFPVKPEARPYLDAFDKIASEPEWLTRERQRALTRFAELGFPTRKSESWRYLDLQPLQREPLLPTAPQPDVHVPAELVLDSVIARLLLIDGRCIGAASGDMPDGVWLASMRRAIEKRPDLVRAAVLPDIGAD